MEGGGDCDTQKSFFSYCSHHIDKDARSQFPVVVAMLVVAVFAWAGSMCTCMTGTPSVLFVALVIAAAATVDTEGGGAVAWAVSSQ